MKKIDYQNELQQIHEGKLLVELYLSGAPTYKVVYVLGTSKESMVFAEINSSAAFAGVSICRGEDIECLSIDTTYLKALSQQMKPEPILSEARGIIGDLKDYTFEAFADTFVNSGEIVELITEDEMAVAGKLMAQTENTLVFDEYSTQNPHRLARSFYKKSIISRMTVKAPWLKTLALSQATNSK